MIDTSASHVCLRLRTLGLATGTSFLIFATLPVCCVVCLAAGLIAVVGCWIPIIVITVLAYGLLIGGALAAVAGLVSVKEAPEVGGPCLVGGCVALVVGYFCYSAMEEWVPSLLATADAAIASCTATAHMLLHDVFIGRWIWLLSWSIMALSLLASGFVILLIGTLRLEGFFKHALFRISYTCPKGHRGVPLFRCPNGHVIRGLRPSRYGVFFARCRDCRARLATLDILGRLSLAKVCAECHEELRDRTLGAESEYHFALVGASSSGKSMLLVALIWELKEEFGPTNNWDVEVPDAQEASEFEQRVNKLKQGGVVDKTLALRAARISVRPPWGHRSRIYLYDTQGEQFETLDRMSAHNFHDFMDGILFVLDPFAEACTSEHLGINIHNSQIAQVRPGSMPAREVLDNLVERLEDRLGIPAGMKIPLPVAVVVTKMDAFDLGDREIGGVPDTAHNSFSTLSDATAASIQKSDTVREFLQRIGLSDVVAEIESRFGHVAFFASTVFGGSGNKGTFAPRGVTAPLLWISHLSGAITDSYTITVIARNALSVFARSIRGTEGPRAQILAVALAASVVSVTVALVWYLL